MRELRSVTCGTGARRDARRRLRTVTAALLVAGVLATGASALQGGERGAPSEHAVEQEMQRRANQERVRVGLPELIEDKRLVEAARAHSKRMAERRTLTHQFPDEPELKVRVSRTDLRFDSVAENVSVTDDPDPAAASHVGLMHSPGHRANILAAASNAIGVGVERHGDTYYITQDFAHAYPPLSAHELEETLVRQVSGLRYRLGLQELKKVSLSKGDRLACREDATPENLVRTLPDARHVILFTTWAGDRLPEPMNSAARQGGLEAFAIHVCALEASQGGAGQFKVVVVFF